jgi:hypothetical protein
MVSMIHCPLTKQVAWPGDHWRLPAASGTCIDRRHDVIAGPVRAICRAINPVSGGAAALVVALIGTGSIAGQPALSPRSGCPYWGIPALACQGVGDIVRSY